MIWEAIHLLSMNLVHRITSYSEFIQKGPAAAAAAAAAAAVHIISIWLKI